MATNTQPPDFIELSGVAIKIRTLPLPPGALMGLLSPDGQTGVIAMNDGSIYKFVWNKTTQTVSILERIETHG